LQGKGKGKGRGRGGVVLQQRYGPMYPADRPPPPEPYPPPMGVVTIADARAMSDAAQDHSLKMIGALSELLKQKQHGSAD